MSDITDPANPLITYRVQNGKRVAKYRIAVIFGPDKAYVFDRPRVIRVPAHRVSGGCDICHRRPVVWNDGRDAYCKRHMPVL